MFAHIFTAINKIRCSESFMLWRRWKLEILAKSNLCTVFFLYIFCTVRDEHVNKIKCPTYRHYFYSISSGFGRNASKQKKKLCMYVGNFILFTLHSCSNNILTANQWTRICCSLLYTLCPSCRLKTAMHSVCKLCDIANYVRHLSHFFAST